jgi:ADP-ribose pyrophosphatase YjhB (NUDIX family)
MQRKDLFRKRRNDAVRIGAIVEDKGASITSDVMVEMAEIFGTDPVTASAVAEQLAMEHSYFANTNTLSQLENHSMQTVVGIGYYRKGRTEGYIIVSNADKSGHGFPGGRTRLGESPEVALQREIPEETGLNCAVGNLIDEFIVGDEGHKFSIYEIVFTGGKIRVPVFNKEEPIDGVIAVAQDLLEKACRENGLIQVKGLATKGILPSHRRGFLTYLLTKLEAKGQAMEAQNVQLQPTA